MALLTFEEYVAKENDEADEDKSGRATCEQCDRKPPKGSPPLENGARLTRTGYCECCMRYCYGYDQAEELVTTALIGGVVKAALEQEIPRGVLKRAIEAGPSAFEEEEREYEARLRAGGKVTLAGVD